MIADGIRVTVRASYRACIGSRSRSRYRYRYRYVSLISRHKLPTVLKRYFTIHGSTRVEDPGSNVVSEIGCAAKQLSGLVTGCLVENCRHNEGWIPVDRYTAAKTVL